MHVPAAIAHLFNVAHGSVRKELRAVACRIRQVSERDRILGADIATPATVATAGAGWLGDAGGIGVLFKAHGHARGNGRCIDRLT